MGRLQRAKTASSAAISICPTGSGRKAQNRPMNTAPPAERRCKCHSSGSTSKCRTALSAFCRRIASGECRYLRIRSRSMGRQRAERIAARNAAHYAGGAALGHTQFRIGLLGWRRRGALAAVAARAVAVAAGRRRGLSATAPLAPRRLGGARPWLGRLARNAGGARPGRQELRGRGSGWPRCDAARAPAACALERPVGAELRLRAGAGVLRHSRPHQTALGARADGVRRRPLAAAGALEGAAGDGQRQRLRPRPRLHPRPLGGNRLRQVGRASGSGAADVDRRLARTPARTAQGPAAAPRRHRRGTRSRRRGGDSRGGHGALSTHRNTASHGDFRPAHRHRDRPRLPPRAWSRAVVRLVAEGLRRGVRAGAWDCLRGAGLAPVCRCCGRSR